MRASLSMKTCSHRKGTPGLAAVGTLHGPVKVEGRRRPGVGGFRGGLKDGGIALSVQPGGPELGPLPGPFPRHHRLQLRPRGAAEGCRGDSNFTPSPRARAAAVSTAAFTRPSERSTRSPSIPGWWAIINAVRTPSNPRRRHSRTIAASGRSSNASGASQMQAGPEGGAMPSPRGASPAGCPSSGSTPPPGGSFRRSPGWANRG